MENRTRIIVVLLVIIGIVVVALLKHSAPTSAAAPAVAPPPPAPPATAQATKPAESPDTSGKLPTLLEFGAGHCMACQAMMPVIDKLREQYQGKLRVISVNIDTQRELTEKYGITMIPQQVLLAPDSHEIGRHTGYWPQKQILAKFAELGYVLTGPAAGEAAPGG